MLKRMVIMLIAVGLVFAGVFGFEAFKNKMIHTAIASLSNPPQTVSTIVARSEKWSNKLEAVGNVRAINGVLLSSQVAGTIAAIHFRAGTQVKQGALLIELSAADDIAHLEALKATTELARITYERDKTLASTKAVSAQTADSDKWTLKNDEAQVAQQQALVNYKFIKAPFSGRIGIRQADLGQYVAAGTAVVALQQLDPIYVDFYLPQQSLAQIKVDQQVTANVDTYPGVHFSGEISAINSLVDPATRNVLVRATFKNPEDQLLPGMFATVDVDIGVPQNYVTLPQTAIAYNSYGNLVYLVESKGKNDKGQPQLFARQTFVTTGSTRGDQIAVLSGVKEGNTVVTAGQVKLHNGTPLVINNTVQPSNNPNPQPTGQ